MRSAGTPLTVHSVPSTAAVDQTEVPAVGSQQLTFSMRILLAAVADEPNAKLMFEWLLKDELQPGDRLHILHVAMRDQTDAALPASDYFDQVGCTARCKYV